MNTISVQTSILRNNLAKALDSIEKKTHDYMLVMTKGKPKAAIVNIDFLEDLLAMSSTKYKNEIKLARKQAKKGEFLEFEELFGEL